MQKHTITFMNTNTVTKRYHSFSTALINMRYTSTDPDEDEDEGHEEDELQM